MKTRLATPADIPAMVDLLNVLFEQEMDFTPSREAQARGLDLILSSAETGQLIVAEDNNGSIVGMVSILYMPSTAKGGLVAILEDMIVDANVQGKGIGKLLINAAKTVAGAHGCMRITLLTDADNLQAHAFYERCGFSRSEMVVYRTLVGSDES